MKTPTTSRMIAGLMALFVLAAQAAQAQAVLTDLGSNTVTGQYVLPTPVSPADIANLTGVPVYNSGSRSGYSLGTTGDVYAWNRINLSPGESFQTGNNAAGYELTSVSLQTGDPSINDVGTDVLEPFTLTIYQISSTNMTNCTVLACYTAYGQLTNAGDWFSWTGLAVDLQPNTTYAYAFSEASSSTAGNNWDVLDVVTNNPDVPNTNQTIGMFPDGGGVINYGAATVTNYTALFDIGLTVPAGPVVANTPAVNSSEQLPLPLGVVQGNCAVARGSQITLSAAPGGQMPFTYQWQTDGGSGNKLTNIPGATSSTLVVTTADSPQGTSNQYAYVAYNPVSTAGVTSAVECISVNWPAMVDLGVYPSSEGGGAIPPSPGQTDISQLSTAANAYSSTSITMRTDGGFENGLWPAQTFTTSNTADGSGWLVTNLVVKTAGGGNIVLDVGWGTGFNWANNLYDVAFYSLSGTGTTTATLIAGPYKFYGRGTEDNWMQFGPLNVHLSPNTTYAFVWDLDSANTNITAGQTPDIYEDIWITGGDPTLQGGGAAGGQICVIQAPNAVAATPNQVIPNQGLVTYNSPAQTYSMTFDLGIVPLSLSGSKTTPTITTAPTASAITYGQALTSSTLKGGLASVPGNFVFTTPSTTPSAGKASQSVTFTPADTNDYNTVTLNVSVTVNKATPTITTAPTASAITYGQALSSSTLNGGLASVPGNFVFTTPSTTPSAGKASQSVTFAPADTNDYNTVTLNVSVTVNKATPTITTAPTASAITYGQALSSSTLNGGLASVSGSFALTTPSAIPTAGTASQSVTFTPADTNDYNTVTLNVSVTVNKATPTITTAPTASAITYGQALSSSTLSGGVGSVSGSFALTTPSAIPTAGTASQSVTFTPADTNDYNTVTLNVSVTVNKATPTITTAPTASAITYGQALSSSTLSGGVASVPGSFAFTTPSSIPSAGTASQSVTFTPTDTVDYSNASAAVTINVQRAASVITWAPPAAITYGTALNSNQLDASANVPGTFVYNPPAGAVLDAGSNKILSGTFTPTDIADYTSATNTVSLVVSPAPLIVTAANANRAYGQTNPMFTGAIVGLTNSDNITATYSCAATNDSPIGTYAIVPSLVDPNNRQTNYTVHLVNGTLTVMLPPAITAPPQNAAAVVGGNASFGVTATGGGILAYQWQFSGTNIAGATNNTLTLTGVTTAQAGYYRVVVSNPVASVSSSPVLLTVLASGTTVPSGNVNGVWTAGNSPYLILGNLTVNDLAIQPGVHVLFAGPFSLTVTGLLQAAGTSNSPVLFTGAAPDIPWLGLRFVSANTNSVLSWCVVSGATAGGIRFANTPLAMSNCMIVSNAGVSGGGIYTDSALWLQNCMIANNQATCGQQASPYFVQGGGLYSVNGGVTLQSCLVSNNTAIMPDIGAANATSTGGGIDCEAGTLTLNDCVVVSNQAAGAGLSATALGGGVYMNSASATASATACVFQGNSATGGFGGGASLGVAGLLACSFSGNQATYGGAVYTGGSGQTMATNLLLMSNAAVLGGAVYSTASQAAGDFENCTLVYNSPDGFNGYTGLIHDSILVSNGTEIIPGPVNPVVNYSDVQGGYSGLNNLNVDPQFANTTNYLLGNTSPCIDAGDPAPQYDDGAFPPAQLYGTDLNDLGAYGGPGGAFWPAFANLVPAVLVNGQSVGPYGVLTFANTTWPTISFANGFSGGSFGYSLDGSNPAGDFNYSGPFVVGNSVVVRVVAYSGDESSYAISAPVFVDVPPGFPVAVSTAGGGSVSPTSGVYQNGSVVTLTATASNGWRFLYWTNGVAGASSTVDVTVNGPLTNVQAVFGTPLVVNVTPIGSGTVQTNPVLAFYPYGSTAQLMASPGANRYFTNWNIAGVLNSVSPLDLIVTNATPGVTAVFGNPPASHYSLNLSVTGGGNVSRNPQAPLYPSGSVVAVTATPAAGWVFTGWTGNVTSSANPLNVTMTANMSITANFATVTVADQPPGITITNPVNGAQFALGANITVEVAASDPNTNGFIQQVVFFNGTNQLDVVTNSPFTFLWANAPLGTNILTALVSDNFGLTATSAPVSLTVARPPPGPAVFTLSAASYPVLENAGSVTVTVQKSANSLGGVINYSTANGTALALSQGVGNYQAAAGSLSFAAGQSNQTVSIPIVDNLVYEGNTTFAISLSPSGDGSSVSSPGTATITIIDVNRPSTTNSVLTSIFPSPVPESDGGLEVVTQPSSAQGQWRLTWETVWHNSGDIIRGLPTGNYPVTFSPVAGFVQPPDTTYPVTAGGLSLETNAQSQYTVSGTASYGSLTVRLYPASLAGGKWQLQGDTNWYPSDFVLTNLVSGSHIVEFQNVSGWVAPAALLAFVGANQENVVVATYLLAEQSGATTPSILTFATATTAGFGGAPYAYNGQLLTDVGYGSGCVVQPQVVLTAGHLVFNDLTLSYVNNVFWFFQEYAGIYNPPAQTPRGWYIFGGYAAARTNDLAHGDNPGEESSASQNDDVAALYFLSSAGRGGSSGYLVSATTGTEWLQAATLKTLVGYPVNDISANNVGTMYATIPEILNFSLVTNSVFSTGDIIGYPGNSGGPLCVQYTNGIYYPAGVYLGGTENAIVRAIDGDVATLINDANIAANTGANHSGLGGTPGPPTSGTLLNTGSYTMQIGPPAALPAGAGWMVTQQGLSNYYTDTTATYTLSVGSYTATFNSISGFTAPGTVSFTIAAGQTTVISATYTTTATPPMLVSPSYSNCQLTLGISASPGDSVAIDRSTNLTTWVALTTNMLPASGSMNFTDTILTNAPSAFYRARVVP
jgi:hypothetical protein